MDISLSNDNKKKLTDRLQAYFQKELEISLSDFQTEQLIGFITKDIGPAIYSQAINDVESFIKEKLTDLEGDLIEE